MNEKKNIERLFQEKFKDFEIVPNELVWENIEAKLNEKKKRRIIPFWWKLSGVAAALLIGFFISKALFFSNPIGGNNVVNQENNIPIKIQPSEKFNGNAIQEIKEKNPVVASENKLSNKKSSQDKSQKNSLKLVTTNPENNKGIAYSNEKNKSENSATTNVSQKKSSNYSNLNKSIVANNERLVASNLEKKEATTANNNFENPIEKATTNQENSNSIVTNIATNPKTTFENKSSEAFHSNESILVDNPINKEIKNIDTTKIAVVDNALEELLKEKEVKKKAESKLNRWQVATTVAPIYFSSTSGGSPLDSRFETNDKEFEPSYSYGLGVNYAINKKLSIRTGVNILAFEYNTNNIVFFQNPNAREIKHVKNNLQGSILEVENKSNSIPTGLAPNSQFAKKFDGSLNQKMGYLEIPLEVGYKLISKKFGVEVITGISSLILNENTVAVVSSNQSITIGEANNLNTLHFSGNLGFGLTYRFWKAFNANVNPMFKYQINTFNSDSGNFKPYVFGLYSGISYSF